MNLLNGKLYPFNFSFTLPQSLIQKSALTVCKVGFIELFK